MSQTKAFRKSQSNFGKVSPQSKIRYQSNASNTEDLQIGGSAPQNLNFTNIIVENNDDYSNNDNMMTTPQHVQNSKKMGLSPSIFDKSNVTRDFQS